VLVSPIAYEDLSDSQHLPDGTQDNEHLSLYTEVMEEVAAKHGVHIVDAFTPTKQWFENSGKPLTIDGSQLSEVGYKRFSKLLADRVFGEVPQAEALHEMVSEKNWI